MQNPDHTQFISVAQIRNPKDHNRNVDPKHVEYLANNIQRHGLRHPITVIANGIGGFDAIAGLHRLEAFRELGRKEIECKILNPSTSKAELVRISLAENHVRKNETLSETFARIDKIRRSEKCTFAEAGRFVEVAKSVVSKLNVIHSKLTPDALQLVDDHPEKLGISIAYLTATKARSPAQQIEWLTSIIDGSMTRDDITRSIKNLTGDSSQKISVNFKLADINVRFAFPKSATYDTLEAALTTLKAELAAVKKRDIHIADLPNYLTEGRV